MQRSLNENSETIVSIFVNPTQFAPTEDLSTYPRPLSSDLSLLSSLSSAPISTEEEPRTVSALFLPPVEALYPGGTSSDIEQQRGAFIQVEGLQDAMEGSSRPGFFRGVATVCLKLFNIVQVSLFLPTPACSDHANVIIAHPSLFRTERHSTSAPPPKTSLRPASLPSLCPKPHHSSHLSSSHHSSRPLIPKCLSERERIGIRQYPHRCSPSR